MSSLVAMTGARCAIQADSLTKGTYTSTGTAVAIMHFAGAVQGDFIITTQEEIVASLLKTTTLGGGEGAIPRSSLADFFSEIINASAGQALPELQKRYGALTLIPPSVVFGELYMPRVLSCSVVISGAEATLTCTVCINMASLAALSTKES
jgi:CheY-specific phosphatase CheX